MLTVNTLYCIGEGVLLVLWSAAFGLVGGHSLKGTIMVSTDCKAACGDDQHESSILSSSTTWLTLGISVTGSCGRYH